ncbi:S16 family serine protease [uncultured Agrococcus sp.]|uniref:YlbL family protein n=1 Tax=uncultured Agrococcus sp. TaxID=382258 RepID=UPI0025CD064E|nr:S16 family serine protease [uncultured Agrococcus sp.]
MFRRRTEGRRAVGTFATLAALLALATMAFLPSPFITQSPGPTFDTLGETDEGPIIEVSDAETYPVDGELRLLTISLRGNPDNPLNWAEVAAAYFSPDQTVLPMEAVYGQVTVEERNQQSQADMENSQDTAIAAALLQLGYDVDVRVWAAGVLPGSPADGILQDGDVLLTVNGETIWDAYTIRNAAAESDDPVTIVYERDGEVGEAVIEPEESDGIRLIGVQAMSDVDLPLDVTIALPNVGGPSAGMMFSLGVIERLTSGSMTGSVAWAGTGTMSVSGAVGSIGGVVQKMHGALDAGAEWMLVPAENCGEVAGNVPSGLNVVPVETLTEAQSVVEVVANADGDPERVSTPLPSCG